MKTITLQALAPLLLGSLLAATAPVLAAADDHADENFPEGALLILEGEDAITKKECQLFVMDAGYTGPEKTPEQFFAKVLTGYTHDSDAAEIIEVKVSTERPEVLIGTGANGKDQIAIFLAAGQDLQTAVSFNAKWWHVNHLHNNSCKGLRVHAH